jgi:hypothetical protein
MKQILLILAMGLALWVRPAAAQDSAHQAVIASQIEAFQADDFVRAFSYASRKHQGNPLYFGLI